jgi:hypothetical protein
MKPFFFFKYQSQLVLTFQTYYPNYYTGNTLSEKTMKLNS